MRKFFYVLGIVFTVLIVVAGVGVFYAVRSTSTVDAEGKTYVDGSLAAILPNWSSAELLKRASPGFKRATTPEDLRAFLDTAAAALGGPVDYQSAKSEGTNISSTVGSGTIVTAKYLAQVRFQKGSAIIAVAVRKIDGDWVIDSFNINSAELMRYMTGKPS